MNLQELQDHIYDCQISFDAGIVRIKCDDRNSATRAHRSFWHWPELDCWCEVQGAIVLQPCNPHNRYDTGKPAHLSRSEIIEKSSSDYRLYRDIRRHSFAILKDALNPPKFTRDDIPRLFSTFCLIANQAHDTTFFAVDMADLQALEARLKELSGNLPVFTGSIMCCDAVNGEWTYVSAFENLATGVVFRRTKRIVQGKSRRSNIDFTAQYRERKANLLKQAQQQSS